MSTFTGGCDPWGVPCPTHGADHWRNAIDRLTAERDAAVERVQRVREVRPSHTGCLSWREVHQALDGGEAT